MKYLLLTAIIIQTLVGFSQQEGITVVQDKVGIGTTSPTSRLDVNGKLSVKDTISGFNNPVLTNGVASLTLGADGLNFNTTSPHNLGQFVHTITAERWVSAD